MNKMPCHITDLPDDDCPEIEEVDTYDFDRQRRIDEEWAGLEKELKRITRSLGLHTVKREGE